MPKVSPEQYPNLEVPNGFDLYVSDSYFYSFKIDGNTIYDGNSVDNFWEIYRYCYVYDKTTDTLIKNKHLVFEKETIAKKDNNELWATLHEVYYYFKQYVNILSDETVSKTNSDNNVIGLFDAEFGNVSNDNNKNVSYCKVDGKIFLIEAKTNTNMNSDHDSITFLDGKHFDSFELINDNLCILINGNEKNIVTLRFPLPRIIFTSRAESISVDDFYDKNGNSFYRDNFSQRSNKIKVSANGECAYIAYDSDKTIMSPVLPSKHLYHSEDGSILYSFANRQLNVYQLSSSKYTRKKIHLTEDHPAPIINDNVRVWNRREDLLFIDKTDKLYMIDQEWADKKYELTLRVVGLEKYIIYDADRNTYMFPRKFEYNYRENNILGITNRSGNIQLAPKKMWLYIDFLTYDKTTDELRKSDLSESPSANFLKLVYGNDYESSASVEFGDGFRGSKGSIYNYTKQVNNTESIIHQIPGSYREKDVVEESVLKKL